MISDSISTANSNTLIVIGDARNNYRTIDARFNQSNLANKYQIISIG